jgi:hypothetical protein
VLRRDGSGGKVLWHAAAIEKFVELDGCSPEAKQETIRDQAGDGTTIDVEFYSGCSAGTEVRGYVVNAPLDMPVAQIRAGSTFPLQPEVKAKITGELGFVRFDACSSRR